MMTNRLLTFFIGLLLVVVAWAQPANPVHFSSELKELEDDEAEIIFTATIDAGWHVYSSDIGDDGPTPATFTAERIEGVELVGKLQPRGQVREAFDAMFGMTVRFFEDKCTFVQRLRFTQSHYAVNGYLEYGACNDQVCLPPTSVEFSRSGSHTLASKPDAGVQPVPIQEGVAVEETADNAIAAEEPDSFPAAQTDTLLAPDADGVGTANEAWAPIVEELQAFDTRTVSWWTFFLEGLLAGLLAVLTPCVWPIIPMTVSFFLKRNKDRRKALSEALTYGLSIVVIYVLLGVVVTLLFGASALNALSTNAIFNIFFALLLIVFAASFMGAFELTLPSSWSNKVDQKSESTTGLLSIFLMAFTLVLVSFSCTGPIVGFLLVAVGTQDSIAAPTFGMLGFAIALAIPFTLFALFPSLLKQAPKSGRWMNTVKVTLGFIELAFALKFLSVADLSYGWHLLDREAFLVLWIVLFALLGTYLLGWLRFPHDDENRRTNVPQFFLGWLSLAFALYMVPGLWGAPLKAISAFAPPMATQDFNLYEGSVEARFTDYEQGLEAAQAEGKPVMIDFTGFGCVNCRKMEAAVWTDPVVRDIINNEYVLISLYVDDKTPLQQPMDVTDVDGSQRRLRTVGDKWSYLQRLKVGVNTQPCYLLLNPVTGKPLNGLRSYNEDIGQYIDFLQQGLKKSRESKADNLKQNRE